MGGQGARTALFPTLDSTNSISPLPPPSMVHHTLYCGLGDPGQRDEQHLPDLPAGRNCRQRSRDDTADGT